MLTVHVGLHKTGSTSIQTVLSLEKGHIRRKQLYLRWHDLFVTDGHVRTENAARIIALSLRGWHVVVSSEGALGPMTQAYPQAADVAAELAHLFQEIPLRVVLYLRPQHEWAESAFRQHLKEGGAGDPDGFAERLLSSRGFHHATLVEDLSASLPPGALIVRPYDSTTDVVGDFFDQCALGIVPPAFAGLRANASRSADPDSPASPFSPAVQEALHRHFQGDWGRLVGGQGTSVEAWRSDLREVFQAQSSTGIALRPVGVVAEVASGNETRSGRRSAARHTRQSAAQRAVWTVRHGARQLLLRTIARRDARPLRPLQSRHPQTGAFVRPLEVDDAGAMSY